MKYLATHERPSVSSSWNPRSDYARNNNAWDAGVAEHAGYKEILYDLCDAREFGCVLNGEISLSACRACLSRIISQSVSKAHA